MANGDYADSRSSMAPDELINYTETPNTVKTEPGKNKWYNRLKMTGASFKGLSENITKGNLKKKIKEYNAEYAKLMRLAEQLTGGPESARAAYDAAPDEEKDKVREDAIKAVNDFNKQVKRLAELGVGILVFKDEMLKAKMDKKGGKPIRVPGKLLTAMYKLTTGGQKQLELQEVQLQKQEALERKMVDAIVQEAQNIMDTSDKAKDQGADGTAMENWGTDENGLIKFADVNNLQEIAVAAISDEKAASEPPKSVEPVKGEEGKGEKPVNKPGTAPKGHSEKNERLEAVKGIVEKIKNEPTALKGLLAIPSDGKINLKVKANPKLLICKNKSITEADWGKVVGIENEEDRKVSYNQFIDLCVMRDAWLEIEAEEIAKTETVFNYVISAVRDGKSQEDVRNNIPETFTEAEKAVVTLFTEDFEKLTNGVKGLDTFVGVKADVKDEELEEKGAEVEPVTATPEDMAVFNRLGNNVYKLEKAKRVENIQQHLAALKDETTEYEAMSIVAGNEKFMLYLKSVGVDGLKIGYKDSRKPFTVSPKEWGSIVGKDNEEEAKVAYEKFGNLWLLAETWEKLVNDNKLENPEEVFNYVVAAVRSGQEQEEIRSNVPETFDDVKKNVVTQLTEDFEKLTKGVSGLDEYVGVKVAVKTEETPEIEPDKDENVPAEVAPVVEEPKKEEPAQVQNNGGSYGSRFFELTKELSYWLDAKKELEKNLEENKDDIANADNIIKGIRNQLSEIIELHPLGKRVVKTAEEPKSVEVAPAEVAPVSEEPKNVDVAPVEVAPVSEEPKNVDVAPAEVAPVSEEPKNDEYVPVTEEEVWWSRVLPILDNPDNKDLNIDQLNRQVDEVNRQMFVDRYKEKRKNDLARQQLKHCKQFEGINIDEFIAENGHSVVEEDQFSTPAGLVDFMQKRMPKIYGEMMDDYNASMDEKKRQLMEKRQSLGEEEQSTFSKK